MKIVKILFFAVLFFFANQLKAQNGIVGLSSTIQLQSDSTVIYLTDYFPVENKMDSIICPRGIWISQKTEKSIIVKGQLPVMFDIMSFYNKSGRFDILVRQSKKVKVSLEFKLPEACKKLEIKGTFSSWSTSENGLSPLAELPSNVWRWESNAINKGTHQFKLVADGKEIDALNFATISNGMGGTNIVLNVGQEVKNKPLLSTFQFDQESIKIKTENCTGIICFWENQMIYQTNKVKTITKLILPKNASSIKRSVIRVFAYNESSISNDLFIPLENGKVIGNTSVLERSDKHNQILYFLMVDRFFDGDRSNNPKPLEGVLPKADYYGGDLKGVEDKINSGFFTDLGVNSVWLSPISENPSGAWGFWNKTITTKFSAYHGYWPTSYSKVDQRFGSNQNFTKTIQAAHSKQMNIILDFVAHHIHTDHPLYKQHPDWVTPLMLPDGSMNTERWDDHRLTTWFDTFLPTLAMDRPEVREIVADSVLFWLNNFEIDGFRHDASKHVPEEFWRLLTQKIKLTSFKKNQNSFYQIGETYGSPELIGSYVNSGEMDGQFDFNLYDAALNVFAFDFSVEDEKKSWSRLSSTLSESFDYYGSHHLMGNISGNQDKPRFISLADGSLRNDEDTKLAGWTRNIQNKGSMGFDKLSQMMAFNMTIPGVPVIYYGDEIGMPGGNDPDNRRMMQFDGYNSNQQKMKETTKQLVELRSSRLELIYGELRVIPVSESVFVFERNYFGKKSIVIFCKSATTIQIPNLKNEKWVSQFSHPLESIGKSISIKLNQNDFEILSN